jgi:N-acetylneuraminic acid mutarotase
MNRSSWLPILLVLACSSSQDPAAARDPADGGGPGPDASGAPPSPSDAAYETLPALRSVRQEHAVVAYDGRVCVIGGFAPAITSTVDCFDPGAGTWELLADFPVALHHANAAALGGKIYVLGYLTDLAFSPTGDSYAYDGNGWTPVASMPADRHRGSAGVAVVGTDVYVIGGASRGSVADVDIYDTVADTWRQGPPLPSPREHMCVGTVGDRIVVAGGRSGGIVSHTDVVLSLAPGANTWEEVAPMPTSRGGCAGATLAGRFHVFGGEGNPGHPSGVFADAEAYDPELDEWFVLAPMPVPRHGFGAATLGDRIYLPGGATQQAFGAVSDVDMFFYR